MMISEASGGEGVGMRLFIDRISFKRIAGTADQRRVGQDTLTQRVRNRFPGIGTGFPRGNSRNRVDHYASPF